MTHKMPITLVLLMFVGLFSGCSTIKVDIQSPADMATVGPDTFSLQSSIRSSGRCMGGERCDHVDWVLEVDGATVCSGTGTGGSGAYSWCGNTSPEYCVYRWSDIRLSDIGNRPHTITIKANASCHREGQESIEIKVP